MGRVFAGYCAFGVALWLGLQAFVSIGVNLGMLPTKGLTLPLISSGGSSLLMTLAAIGLLLRVSFELDRTQRQVAKHRAGLAQGDAPIAADPMHERLLAPQPPRQRVRVEPILGEMA
jgi:cell division protein FtsW